MSNDSYISSVEDLIATTESLVRDSDHYILFLGQPCNKPLLPKIARRNPKNDTSALEEKVRQQQVSRGTGVGAGEPDVLGLAGARLMCLRVAHGVSCVGREQPPERVARCS
jgi:hypothetical protein